MILVFDTETTGKYLFNLPVDDLRQPKLVQLGAMLIGDDFKVRAELNVIISEFDRTIPKEASDVHGITEEIADTFGISESRVLNIFFDLLCKAKIIVAHNIDFDIGVIRSAFCARGRPHQIMGKERFCTMKAMTDICKIPGPYGHKWPTLQEAYRFAFGETFDGAHDAMADVRACARLYRWIQHREAS